MRLIFSKGRKTTGNFSVSDYEKFINGVHDAVMVSNVCGFDQVSKITAITISYTNIICTNNSSNPALQWIDNHIAVDSRDHRVTLADLAKDLDRHGLHYHWWEVPGGMYQVGSRAILFYLCHLKEQIHFKFIGICILSFVSDLCHRRNRFWHPA